MWIKILTADKLKDVANGFVLGSRFCDVKESKLLIGWAVEESDWPLIGWAEKDSSGGKDSDWSVSIDNSLNAAYLSPFSLVSWLKTFLIGPLNL